MRRTLATVLAVLGLVLAAASPSLPRALAQAGRTPTPAHAVINFVLRGEIARAERRSGALRDQIRRPRLRIEIVANRDVSGAVRAAGGTIRANIRGRVVAAVVLADRINGLAAIPGVRGIYPSQRFHPLLDISVPEIHAPLVWAQHDGTGSPIMGKGVLVGIVDSGIDYHNPDFQNPDGTTRIDSIWDQTTTGTPPSGFSFGNECDRQSINSGACSERDTDGHGTHVAGIAAGNGRSSEGREVGVAPRANLIVVKSDLSDDNIIAAWQYMAARAAQLHEPLVVNNSFGSVDSPHDGSGPLSDALANLESPGRVFVASAGNSGHQGLHTRGTLTAGDTSTIQLTTSDVVATSEVYLSYPTGDVADVTVTNTDTGEQFGPLHQNAQYDPGTSDDGTWKLTVNSGAYDDSYNAFDLQIQSLSKTTRLGHYRIDIQPQQVEGGSRFDAWMDDAQGHFANPEESDTVASPADSSNMIAVGNYATRLTWEGSDGSQNAYCDGYDCPAGTLAVGDIAPSSSVGPTADGRQKPDLAAPGAVIISSKSADITICTSDTQTDCTDPALVTPDGKNLIDSGTSMSAPHVAGVIALMLQVNPTLDQEAVTVILRSTARHDAFTGPALWTPGFGAGKVDALAAVEAVPGAPMFHPPTPTPGPTASPPPTPTATETGAPASTSAPGPIRFSAVAARVEYGSAKPRGAFGHASLKAVKPGQRVKLFLFASFSGITATTPVQIGFRVTRTGGGTHLDRWVDQVTSADNGGITAFFAPYTAGPAGTYTFTATISLGAKHQHKSAGFTVVARYA